jgi:hypothetical protein
MDFSAEDIVGRPMHDNEGKLVGQVTAWYRYPPDLDVPCGAAAVRVGRMLRSTHLVDLLDVAVDARGIDVAYPAELINSAPHHAPMVGDTLSHEHAADVLAHYRASMTAA